MPPKPISAEDVITSLGAVSNHWLQVASDPSHEAVQALVLSTGLHSSHVQAALHNVFAEASSTLLLDYWRSLGKPWHESPKTVLHVAAGNVFTAWLHGALITLLIGDRLILKPSTHEPLFAALWQKSVAGLNGSLAERIIIRHWTESLIDEADLIVAYGSDETIRQLKAKSGQKPFIGYGQKWSIAIVFKEAIDAWSQWQARAEADIRAFHLEGCLSPQVLFVPEGAPDFSGLAVERGPKIVSWKHLGDIRAAIHPLHDKLSCIGIAGEASRYEEVRQSLNLEPAVRLCELGRMQRPELSWRNGGISLGENLLQL